MRSGCVRYYGVVGVWILGATGCVSLDDHLRLKAANRNLTAEKETISQELFDERHVNDTLRARLEATERELNTKNELIANLRGENELLDELRKDAKGTLEGMANRKFGDIVIPKLPAPLDTALKQFAEQHPSEVAYDPSTGNVKWTGDLLFPLGSDEVRPSSMDSLRGFADVLRSPAASAFEAIIVGHTDTRPIQRSETRAKHPTNWHLSTHRAIAVGHVLQRYGYSAERIGCMGCGEYRPVAENSTEAGQSANRRVEIYLVPTGSIVPPAQRLTARPGRPATGEEASAVAKPGGTTTP